MTSATIRSHSIAAGVMVLIAAVAVGCSSDSPDWLEAARLADPFNLPDVMQQRIAPVGFGQGVWIPGTRTVAGLVGQGTCSLDVFDADTHSATVLVADVLCGGGPGTHQLAAVPDGTAIFFLDVGPGDSTMIRRVTLADHKVSDVVAVLLPGAFDVSPHAERLVYASTRDNSFRVRDLSSGVESIVVAPGSGGTPWSVQFSPDGTEVLVADSARYGLRRINTATGVSQLLPGQSTAAFGWTATGVQAAVSGWVANLTTGATLPIHGVNELLSFAPDGLHVAGQIWWVCTGHCSPFNRMEVAVADWTTHQSVVIAREDCNNIFEVVISPDGNTVMYGSCTGTYLWNRN